MSSDGFKPAKRYDAGSARRPSDSPDARGGTGGVATGTSDAAAAYRKYVKAINGPADPIRLLGLRFTDDFRIVRA